MKALLYIQWFLFLVITNYTFGQGTPPVLFKQIVLNPVTGQLTGDVPFDQPFAFTGILKDHNINSIRLYMSDGICSDDTINNSLVSSWRRTKSVEYLLNKNKDTLVKPDPYKEADEDNFILIFFNPDKNKNPQFLIPYRTYCFQLVATSNSGSVIYVTRFSVFIKAGFSDQVKTDFGLVYAFKPKALIGVTTVNFYLTAINEDTDLKYIRNFGRNIFLRTSVFFGISPIVLTSDTKQPIQNRYALGNFVFGIAIRSPFYWAHLSKGNSRRGLIILQPIRLQIGEILYKQADANPVISATKNKFASYIGLTANFNLATVLGPIGTLLTKI